MARAQGSTSIDFRAIKDAARKELPPGQLGRELLLTQPDELPSAVFDALVPSLIRLLRGRT